MAVTYALGTEMTYAAGANVNSTYVAAGYLEKFGYLAEAQINSESKIDWSAWYVTNGATYPHVAYILVDTAACLGAIKIINADMSGFTNIQEAVSRIDVLYQLYQNNMRILKEEGVRDFVFRGGV